MNASSSPRGGAGVSELLQASARLFAATVLKCLPMAMLALLCAQLPNIYWIASGHELHLRAYHDGYFRLLTLLVMVLELWLMGALMLRQRAAVLGAPILAVSELRAALRRLPAILMSTLLATLSVAVGLLLLIVPGIFLLICYLVLLPVVLFDGVSSYVALRHSVQLMRPLWWQALAALVLASLTFLCGAVLLGTLIAMIAGPLESPGPAFAAIATASTVAFGALFFVYLSALLLVLHSAASNSA